MEEFFYKKSLKSRICYFY